MVSIMPGFSDPFELNLNIVVVLPFSGTTEKLASGGLATLSSLSHAATPIRSTGNKPKKTFPILIFISIE